MNALPSVYFAMDHSGRVKIGYSADPVRRIRSIETISAQSLDIIRVVDGGRRIEQWLHKRFADLRIVGEWFRFSEDMLTIQPPEIARGIPIVTIRRDVRLSLRERLIESGGLVDGLNLNGRERLMLAIQKMNDDEADEALRQLYIIAGVK